LSLVLRSLSTFTGTLTNKVEISHTLATAIDPDDANNTDSEVTPVRFPIADLQISKSTVVTEVIAGDLIDYTIVVTNAAGSDTTDAVVTDTFNAGAASFNNCTGGCTDLGGGVVIWNLNSFTGTQTLTLTLRTSSAFSGTLVNSAVITFAAIGVDTNTLNNQASVATPVRIVIRDIFLPIIMKDSTGPPPCAELQITGLALLGGNVVSVTVTNVGACATDSNFWVDVYGNIQGTQPNSLVGVTADRRWSSTLVNAQYGLGWEVPVLGPGASRLLTTDGSNGGLPPSSPDQNWPPPSGITVIAYADSFDNNDPNNVFFVEIPESDETNNQSTNSIIIAGGLAVEPTESAQFPPRPDLY
jgi:uncharacterized repeat protein (TIGR01451 family)